MILCSNLLCHGVKILALVLENKTEYSSVLRCRKKLSTPNSQQYSAILNNALSNAQQSSAMIPKAQIYPKDPHGLNDSWSRKTVSRAAAWLCPAAKKHF